MNMEYVRNLHNNYVRLLLEEKPETNKYQYCILNRGGIKNLLPCSLRYIDGDAYLYYDITSKQNIVQLHQKDNIKREWLLDFMDSFRSLQQELGRFLLQEENIIWEPKHIFQDLERNQFFYLYIPYYQGENAFLSLLSFFVERIDYEDEVLVECVYKMYEQMEKIGETYLQEQIFKDVKILEEHKRKDRSSVRQEGFSRSLQGAADIEKRYGESGNAALSDRENTQIQKDTAERGNKPGRKNEAERDTSSRWNITGHEKTQGARNTAGYESAQGRPETAGYESSQGSQDASGYGSSAQGRPDAAGYENAPGHPGTVGYEGVQGRSETSGYGSSAQERTETSGYESARGHSKAAGYEKTQGQSDTADYENAQRHRSTAGYEGAQGYTGSSGYEGAQGYAAAGNESARGRSGSAGYENRQGRFGEPERESAPSKEGSQKKLFGFFENRKNKKMREQEERERYRADMQQMINGYAVAEQPEYEEEYGRTTFISKPPETKEVIHRLYYADGRKASELDIPNLLIGKYKDKVDLFLEDESVSRMHARILCDQGEYFLEDENSTNGTFVNQDRLQPYEKKKLSPGDELMLGNVVLFYR